MIAFMCEGNEAVALKGLHPANDTSVTSKWLGSNT